MKRVLSLILTAILIACVALPAGAAGDTAIKLYSFYDDDMLFCQNEPAVFAGTAPTGTKIKCVLSDESGAVIAQSTTTAANGKFEVSFIAPTGGYKEYSVVFICNDTIFDSLSGVVFGELWLASGQSNMQLGLAQTAGWQEMQNNGYGSKWIRVLQIPNEPTVDGKKAVPIDEQDNLEDCYWLKADSAQIGVMSGVAYYFADELMKELDMPVGVLNVSLGGSTIRSWISRDVLENSQDAMKVLNNHNEYISEKVWYEGDRSYYSDMSGNYNAKIYPLRRFNISGLIWYQGESDLFSRYQYGEYSTMLGLLQQNFTQCFGCDKTLPLVYTHLASFNYRMDNRHLQALNAEFTDIQQLDPTSRAVISISDVSLDFDLPVGSIHPKTKEPIGRRMAQSACGLVYGNKTPYTVASLKESKTENGSIYMTFNDVGDGLVCNGEELYDFAVCGINGVYYSAEAEIVSKDTVRVWNDNIKNPKAATYAFSQANCRANLWSTKGDEKYLPVSPSITDREKNKLFYYDTPWADCEQERYWRNATNEAYTGFYDIWNAENCTYTISTDSAFSGTGGLKITSSSNKFSLVENFIIDDGENDYYFNETSRKWSKYGAMSFAVRNCGESDVTLSSVSILIAQGISFSPEINGTGSADYVIPADGQWHIVELDLNELYLYGNCNTFGVSNFVLDEISRFSLNFEGNEGDCIEVDDFQFAPRKTVTDRICCNFTIRMINTVYYFFKAIFSMI